MKLCLFIHLNYINHLKNCLNLHVQITQFAKNLNQKENEVNNTVPERLQMPLEQILKSNYDHNTIQERLGLSYNQQKEMPEMLH